MNDYVGSILVTTWYATDVLDASTAMPKKYTHMLFITLCDGSIGPSPRPANRSEPRVHPRKLTAPACPKPTDPAWADATTRELTDPAWLSHFTVRSVIFDEGTTIFWFQLVILLYHCYNAQSFLIATVLNHFY
jgi:hypothetical protein